MKKLLVTSFCAATLFATQFTTADAANVNEEVKSEPTLQYVENMKWDNYQGFVYKTVEKVAYQNGIEFDMKKFEELVNKALNELKTYKTVQQGETTTNESVNEVVEEVVQEDVQEETPVETPATEVPETTNNVPPVTNNETEATNNQEVEAPVEAPATTDDQSISEFEQQVVDLTNAERAKAGLAPLEIHKPLMAVAEAKSADMAKNNYFDHNSPTYGSPFDQIKAAGISYRSAGENIAQGQRSPEEVVQAWMNSAGHRANILNGSYTHIGVGFVEDGNYWTQQFIQL